jgi:hypothetical protein
MDCIRHLISMIRNVLCGPHEHVANFKTVCRGKHVAMSQKWDTREPKRLVIFNRQSHVWANLNHMPGIKLYFSLWFKMLPILQNTVLEFIGFNTWDVPLRVSLCGICWTLLTSRFVVVQGIEFRKDKGVQSLGSPTGILRVKIEISIFLKQVEMISILRSAMFKLLRIVALNFLACSLFSSQNQRKLSLLGVPCEQISNTRNHETAPWVPFSCTLIASQHPTIWCVSFHHPKSGCSQQSLGLFYFWIWLAKSLFIYTEN